MTELMLEKVHFTALANGGAALGRLADGRVIFADGILPGELALIQYVKTDSRYVNGRLVDVLEPSPHRIQSACPLFGICAGCRLQFLNEADQRLEKQEILVDQLRRIAKISNPETVLKAMIPSPQAWNYRKSARFMISTEGTLCFPTDDPEALIPVDVCPICSAMINELLPGLSLAPEIGVTEVEVREADGEEMQLILYGESDRPETEIEIDFALSVVYSSPSGSYVIAGDSTVLQIVAGLEMAVSEDNDFYPNPAVFDEVCRQIKDWLPADPIGTVLNLNAGTGFWSKWFASRCEQVLALEQDEKNMEDFVLNLDEFENVTLYLGMPQEIIPGLHEKIQLAVCEAGPAGLHKDTIAALAATGVKRIFYLGEDASIVARDAARMLEHGYQLSGLIPFDDEPQTAKISALCIFDSGIHAVNTDQQ